MRYYTVFPHAHNDAVISLCELSDGKVVSISCDAKANMWDVVSRTVIHTWTTDGPCSVLCLIDKESIAIASRNTVKIWNTATRQVYCVLEGHETRVDSLAQLTDGTLLSSSFFDGTIREWNIDTGENVVVSTMKPKIYCIKGLRDGSLAISYGSFGIEVRKTWIR
eukprot:TRINITY_DN16092_c0_g1_i1.p1 TRINITY_DN16092_c0_g1~~TRINITY_DN16092_c0_g1_i1.p1  ORF type:complete len:165 (-),score=13.34 TRINITY_DN16092_c0_g1_i1:5-499(-)